MKMLKTEKGITLIALIITIIILLILAGITIGALTGDNSLINQAGEAKEDVEIASEKEAIDNATIDAMGKNKYGNLEEEEFQNALDNQTGGKAEVTDIGDSFEVYFVDSKRYYEVDSNGNVGDFTIAVTDPYPGDITKDEDGNALDGSSASPYQINCIEDLVALSNMVNGTGMYFKDGQLTEVSAAINMMGKYIVLTTDLNFRSRASYIDSQRTDFRDINGDDSDGNVLMTEMSTGKGFRPISIDAGKSFFGNFNGQGNKIENLYIDYSENETQRAVGLFGNGNSSSTIISNLEVSGEIKGNWHAGGIIGGYVKSIDNCINRANVTGYNAVGGICAEGNNNGISTEVKNCTNYGIITVTGIEWSYTGAGGIMGFAHDALIENCVNKGEIIGSRRGGIIACSGNKNTGVLELINCYNEGKASAGIISRVRTGTVNIINCYNLGETTSGIVNSFSGDDWNSELQLNIYNSYNLGKVSDSGILGSQETVCKKITLNIENCYNAGESNKAIIGLISTNSRTETITNIKNTYYDRTKSNEVGATAEGIEEMSIYNNESFITLLNDNTINNANWKKWKLGEDSYPTFVED